jgi:hypothetical protein
MPAGRIWSAGILIGGFYYVRSNEIDCGRIFEPERPRGTRESPCTSVAAQKAPPGANAGGIDAGAGPAMATFDEDLRVIEAAINRL